MKTQRVPSLRLFLAMSMGTVALATATGCGGGGATLSPRVAQLASAVSSTCVDASATAQTVTVPPAAGVTVTLELPKYDAGLTGCQDISFATGADAATAVTGASAVAGRVRVLSTSSQPAPIMSISLGQAAPQTSASLLGLTTIVAGITISTGSSNVVFPDGMRSRPRAGSRVGRYACLGKS
jgi:hypothetical protein